MSQAGIDINENRLKILQLIFENPGITISELASKVGMHPSAVYRTLKLFEKEYNIVRLVVDKNKVYKIYPSGYVLCKRSVFVVPYIYKLNNGTYVVCPQVFRCPYYEECPYRGKYTFIPGKCRLYDDLTEEDKKKIREMLELVSKIIQEKD